MGKKTVHVSKKVGSARGESGEEALKEVWGHSKQKTWLSGGRVDASRSKRKSNRSSKKLFNGGSGLTT